MDAGLTDFDLTIEHTPAFWKAYFNRGVLYNRVYHDYEQALEDDQAIALQPQLPELYCERGSARAQLGDLQGGTDDTIHAIELDPLYACTYYTRGQIYAKLHQYNESIADYTHFIEMGKPVCTQFADLTQDTYVNRGIAYNLAIELDPADPLAYNNRGQSDVNLGNYQASHETGSRPPSSTGSLATWMTTASSPKRSASCRSANATCKRPDSAVWCRKARSSFQKGCLILHERTSGQADRRQAQ